MTGPAPARPFGHRRVWLRFESPRSSEHFERLVLGRGGVSRPRESKLIEALYCDITGQSLPLETTILTTNLVEAVNGQLEIMRRNSGGYFHSDDTLKFKLGLAISSLENGKWRIAAHSIANVLPQLNAMFQTRFEGATA